MRATGLILGSCALFALQCGPTAAAGPCTTKIDGLTKVMSTKDAGAGPTSGSTASPSTRSPSGDGAQHPPTAAMSEATKGQATSSADVRRQMAGQPTAAEQKGATGSATQQAGGTTNTMEAGVALDRARALDKQGKEAECMQAVQEATRLSGS
jgi:hypothetical protein